MSLIKNREKQSKNKVALHLEIDESVLTELLEYLKWAKINGRGHFIEEACKYVFQTDEEWQKFKQEHYETCGDVLTDVEETDVDIANQMVCEDEGMVNLEEEHNLGRELQKKK
ncbi:hypothetical protein LO80_06345 [Candidatus Francisella endociliophora]|uniref:Uncharacterized protein n=1 Tax=Candidatus Francisella endociliophora TaxID=653937 RepID=A0A097EPW6_9GAMM|nr:hypothetical protein [Francisella sp. FSC1006]AIT09619.1 hypothetical protein LO80_06345 [Francisella sp. FSC1006]